MAREDNMFDWKLFDRAFDRMDQAFGRLDETLNRNTPELPSGTVIHTKIVTKYPDGRTEESESTTRITK